jgi:hypothetical protein
MLLLALMMVSAVPYPAWPKVGVRSWKGIAGLLGVLGIVLGATLYSKYFFFLFGIAYVGYGLVRALILGIIDWPTNGHGHPRRRATDYVDPMEAYGSPPLAPAGAAARGEERAAAHEADDLLRRRRRRRRRQSDDRAADDPS